MSIIKANGISICYITGDFKDIGLKEWVVRHLKGNFRVNQFWADDDVSFELERGDMLGIIGSNGAGKSTLLKAVSGIMVPTKGHMEINGTVAALLELSSGFDGDLTVKENTYLRGAMLGYTRQFMNEKYEEIIDFAELSEFQDRPFKQLSTGMKSRLAFSIACLVSPDILILDEVLSVGDGAFQEKSGNKMKEILSSGVTGIFVSHSLTQVRELCNKILWLDHGKQVGFSDKVELYCDAYEEFLKTKKLPQNEDEVIKLAWDFEREKLEKALEAQKEEAEKLAALEKDDENGKKALNDKNDNNESNKDKEKNSDKNEAVDAALKILKKYRPELLPGLGGYNASVRDELKGVLVSLNRILDSMGNDCK